MNKISIIAAIGENRELGKNGKLLWHISEDLKRFKKLTDGHVVIMGRKTFDSLPEKWRPLPNRINIVVTRDINNFKFEILNLKSNLKSKFSNNQNRKKINNELYVCDSLEAAIKLSKDSIIYHQLSIINNEVFIIGGGQIYQQGIKYVDKLYLTIVKGTYPADVFFPDYSEFNKILLEQTSQDKLYSYTFLELER